MLGQIENPSKKLVGKEDLASEILNQKPEVLVTMGAGDIGLEVPKLKRELRYAS